MDYKSKIAQSIVLEGVDEADIAAAVCPCADPKNGDFCLPCFKFSRALKKSPQQIAGELAASISLPDVIAGCEAAGGYLNFRLDRAAFVREELTAIAARGETWRGSGWEGRTVCLDYSSINIAKPFHIGHLLTTAIGGSLHRIFRYLGANAVGINHLGDWGTQFGKLITAYLKWGDEANIENRSIHALLDLYVRFHKEAETDPALEDEGRAWFKKIEDGDETALKIFERFKEVTLREVDKIYQRLGISFDSYNGESFYNDKLAGVVSLLTEKNLLTESEGAKVVDLSDCDMPPCLILKSDGASLYATRDLAAAIYRKQTYDFDKCLYVVAYQQNLHFKQVFKVLDLMGYPWAQDCVHVPFGMVSLENSGALSTRSGNVVFLKDVLDTAVDKAAAIIEEKNPSLASKQEVAESVGTGAVLFMALSNSRIKDIVFSYDKALSFDGETGPYLQYTHARCCSVVERAGETGGNFDPALLTDEGSYAVVRMLAGFDAAAGAAAEKYEPSILSRYLIDLAQCFNKFYIDHRIIGEAPDLSASRLVLVKAVKDTLRTGLGLILLKAPEKM